MNLGITPIGSPNYNNVGIIPIDARMQDTIRENTAAGVKEKKTDGTQGCITCSNRTYQDQSGDGGVSLQSPTQLSPDQAASAVRAHEGEHIARETSKAKSEGRDVISNSVRIFTSSCPECGKSYVSGGEARTVTAKKESEPQQGSLHQPQQLLDILM